MDMDMNMDITKSCLNEIPFFSNNEKINIPKISKSIYKKCDIKKFKSEYYDRRFTDEGKSMFSGGLSFRDFEKNFCQSQSLIRKKNSYAENSFYSQLDKNN